MPKSKILLVTREETREQIQLIVEESAPCRVYWAPDEGHARGYLEDLEFDLVITDLHIPVDPRTPVDESRRQGLVLARFAEARRRAPSIVLADAGIRELRRAARKLESCIPIEKGFDLEQDLGDALEDLLAPVPEAGRRLRRGGVDVEIKLHLKNQTYRITVPRTHYDSGERYLVIDPDALDKLVKRSRRVGGQAEYKDFEEELHEIGEELLNELESTGNFRRDFWSSVGEVGRDISKVRFRFNVEEDLYPLVLEAIVEKGQRFWMLEAPVSRRLNLERRRPPLFSPAAEDLWQVNCLIVEADTWGPLPGFGKSFKRLGEIGAECAWLEKAIGEREEAAAQVRWRCRRLCAAEARREGRSLGQLLESELRGGDGGWQVVHFAGHSCFDPEAEKGYVLLPTAIEGEIEPLKSETLGVWLDVAETRFLYMSSCDSANEDIVFELARARVPAIVGFRWDINDESATEYAKIFYQDLLTRERPSLEYSFLEARKKMYEKYNKEEDRIWAAPMLILQN